MKITQILTEDVKAEKSLDSIATHMMRALYGHASNELSDEDLRVPPRDTFNLGKIKDIVPSKVLSDFYNRLGNLNFKYTFFGIDQDEKIKPEAIFDWGSKEVVVHFPLNKALRPVFSSSKIHSLLVHELRHALDYSLSKGKAFADKSVRGASEPPRSRRKYGEYERLSHEVNARASEAMLLARRYIRQAQQRGTEIDNERLRKIVMRALREKRLFNIFKSEKKGPPTDNKSFRKLFNRILKYSQDFLEQEISDN